MSRLARDMGVPLSQLQGAPTPVTFQWQGEQVTALLASPWRPEDVAAAVAVDRAKADECPGCSGDLRVTTDPDHQFDWVAEARRCNNCKARADEAESFDNRAGLLVSSKFEPDERIAR